VGESDTGIGGAHTGFNRLTNFDGTFLQVNVPATTGPGVVPYSFAFDLGGAEPQFFEGVLGVPEPCTLLLCLAGWFCAGAVRSR